MVKRQLHGMHSGGGSPLSKNSRVRRECLIRYLNRLVPEIVQVKSAWFLGNDAHLKLSVEVDYIIHGSYSFVTVSYPPVLTATYWFHIIRVLGPVSLSIVNNDIVNLL